jgi:hypothetical protein
MNRKYQTSSLLPPAAVEALKLAASLEKDKPPGSSKRRLDALERVIAEIKKRYPSYFKD